MSQSQLNHSYNTNQKDIHDSINENMNRNTDLSSSHIVNNNTLQSDSTDKTIHLKSTNRSTHHHEVSANNWRIKYYIGLNLVEQPHHIALPNRSNTLPHQSVSATITSRTPPTKLPSQHNHNDNGNNYSLYADDKYHNQEYKENEEYKKECNNNNNDSRLNLQDVNKINNNKSNKNKRKKTNKGNKTIYVLSKTNKTSKTRSQNNTPPRTIVSMLTKHHKKSRLSRLRSRSDGMLSFQANNKKSSSCPIDSIEDDDDNDSINAARSVNNNNNNNNNNNTDNAINNHHSNSINNNNNSNNNSSNNNNNNNNNNDDNNYNNDDNNNNNDSNNKINIKRLPHYRASPSGSLVYQSSRTPPGNNYIQNKYHNYNHNETRFLNKNHKNIQPRKNWSEPVGFRPKRSSSIAIHRSKPLSINKQKVKPRFDVDFKRSNINNSYQPSSNPLFNNLINPDSLVDDEATFDME